MIEVLGKLPPKVYLAYSGGVDSAATLDFLIRKKKLEVELLHVNHGALNSEMALEHTVKISKDRNLNLHIHTIILDKPKKTCYEHYWRNCRYEFFNKFVDYPIITCHHLNDVVETWIFSSCNGQPKLIPYRRDNVIRPFLSNEKKEFIDWAALHSVEYVEDFTNKDTKYKRNLIRHDVMPHILKVNPGIHRTLRKRLKFQFKEYFSGV